MDTDDLRESPNVELAERFLGKGFDVRIYDPIVNPDRLVGANLRHVESQAPAPQPAARSVARGGASRRRGRRRRHPRPGGALAALAADPPRSSSTSTAGSATRSRACRLRGGRLVIAPPHDVQPDRAARPDHRPEPSRSFRPARVARVPDPRSTRATTSRSSARRGKDTGREQVIDGVRFSPTRPTPREARRSASRSSTPTPSSRPPGSPSRPGGAAGSTSSRPATRRTSSGRSPGGSAARRLALRLRPPRPLPRAVRVAVPGGSRACAPGLLFLERATFRTADRVTSTNESYAGIATSPRRQARPSTSPSCAPVRTRSACGGPRRTRSCDAAAPTSSPTSV